MQSTAGAIPYKEKAKFYVALAREIEALADLFWFTSLANVSASLMANLPRINWVGFYLMKKGELALGPFQGLPACTRIALGRGVCGTAARDKKTLLVSDVDAFPGHIVCDSASKSEIVVPLMRENGEVFGVLDVDSPELDRFDEADKKGLEEVVRVLLRATPFPTEF